MASHAQKIVENLTEQEFAELSVDFLIKITNESERGAVLVGGSKIDEYLENLVIKILPVKSKSYQSRLLNYPGPLSSFSGKIELLFAFRIIDEKLYNSLNSLRKIRNDAAHSSKDFSLQKIKNKLDLIYDFEDGFKNAAKELAFKNLIQFKKDNLRKAFIEKGFADQFDYETMWHEKVPDPESNETIQEHLTVWKFSYGLVFLCLKINAIASDYEKQQESPLPDGLAKMAN